MPIQLDGLMTPASDDVTRSIVLSLDQLPPQENSSSATSASFPSARADKSAAIFDCDDSADDIGAVQLQNLSDRTRGAINEVLAKRRSPLAAVFSLAGPAVVASIAYMDPGNFATNIQAGAEYNYRLLWVVLLANLAAMLFQALSAKLGIATGYNLAEICRKNLPGPIVWAMWIVSEISAMATDLAEFLGGAIGISLLFHVTLMAGMVVTAVITYGILLVEGRGFRPMELIIGALVAVIGLCYLIEIWLAPIDWSDVARGLVTPRLDDNGAVTLAVGIVGATVMPHAIYLHSGLTQNRIETRDAGQKRQLVRFSNHEVVVALALAGLVNMAMVVMAASNFHAAYSGITEIGEAYRTLTPLLGAGAAGAFLVSIIASGISSSVVGTMAGQMIMQGFIGFQIPLWLRRLVTMIPAFVIVALGVDTTEALVLSQVVLSVALPVPMIALILFTRRPDIMGPFANGRITDITAIAMASVILLLNIILILLALGVHLALPD